ncbi:hypothetical protein DFQ28_001453 [Apophysomyces sp. BC1034]|nr:hypothetical protein DFQ28_001453 [Apophysomyces sp. BC1034]
MRKYLENTRHRSLADFIANNRETTKDFLKQFKTVDEAEKNLRSKMKSCHSRMYPKAKRKINLRSNVSPLFEECLAELEITGEGLKTLVASTTATGKRIRTRLRVACEQQRQQTKDSVEDISLHRKLKNGYDMTEGFHGFQKMASDSVSKLPNIKRDNEDISEMELTTNYLDAILNPMFHDPENERSFRWWNRKMEITDYLRPDASLVQVIQRQSEFALGFGEVKSHSSVKNTISIHEDLRLARFCKGAIDHENVAAMIAFQAVGFYITFYLIVLDFPELYTMFEIGEIDTPASLKDIKKFMAELDTIKILCKYMIDGVSIQMIHPATGNDPP